MNPWIEKLLAYHRIGRIDSHTALNYAKATIAELNRKKPETFRWKVG